MNKKIIAALVCAGLVFSLAACSGITPTLATQTVKGSEAPAQATYEPVPGGQLTIPIPQNVQSYDPLLAQDEDLINMLSLIYETPLTVDASGKIQPNLVETWKSDESKTDFTFSIRKGIKFQDGKDLTAADVYETIMDILALDGTRSASGSSGEKIAAGDSPDGSADASASAPLNSWTSTGSSSPDTGNSKPEPSASNGGQNGVTQAAPSVNRFTIYNKEIESVTMVDDHTIDIKMKKAGRDALYFMTFPVRPKGASDFKKPVGSGPYQVSSMGDTIKLTKNEKWWKVAPFIETIVAKPLAPKDDKLKAYQSGAINFTSTDNLAASKLKMEGTTQVVDYMTNYYDSLVPNLFENSLKNDQIRQAISYAINRRTLISTVLLNHAVATEMPVPPNFFAFNTKYNTYQIDQDRAKEILAKAGYRTDPNGQGNVLSLSVIVPQIIGQEYRVEAAKGIVKQLNEVGIDSTLEALTPQEYSTRLKSGNFTLAYVSYYMDQNNDLEFMFSPDAESNFGHVASQELMDDIQAANSAVTENEMIAAYDKLEKYFMDKVPQIGLYYRMNSIVTDSNVRGIGAPYENHIFGDIPAWSIQ